MPVVEELQLLNRVLEDKDWRHITDNDITVEHFPVMGKVYVYLEQFKRNNGNLPTIDTVLNTFEEFELIEPERIEVVVGALKEDLLHRKFTPILKNTAQMVANKQTEEALQLIKLETANLLKQTGSSSKGYSYIGNAEKRKENYLSIHGRTETDILGATTGFEPLDVATNGIISGGEETDYFLVFAPSNMGKTLISSFMLASAWNSSNEWDYPAYFALEQSSNEIARNWDNIFANVSSLALQRGTLTGEQRDRYVDFLDRLQKKKKDMMIYSLKENGGRPYTVQDIHRILESEGHTRFTLDQLSKVRLSKNMMGGHGDLRQRLFDVSAEVRNMILDTEVAGYVLAQANRESSRRVKKSLEDGEITGEDVGETFAIYQDASKGISIVKIDDTTFKIQVIKNRGNSSGQNFLVRYNFDTGLVTTLDTNSSEQFF